MYDIAYAFGNLLIICVAILVIAYLYKRFNHSFVNKTNGLKLSQVLSVGHREKIILLEVNDTALVIGSTTQAMTILHQFKIANKEVDLSLTEIN